MESVTLEEARRAIYIDFEGTAVDPPSLLGALWAEESGLSFVQFVIEDALWPAATARGDRPGWACKPATWSVLSEVRSMASREGRRIIAWSDHEREELVKGMPSASDQEWFDRHVVNAIPIAERWKNRRFPDVMFVKDPNRRMRGKNYLDRYFNLIGYEVPSAFGPGNSASRIRDVRNGLQKRDGQYELLTPTMKGKWTKALQHNWYDCNGLRELMIRCCGDAA